MCHTLTLHTNFTPYSPVSLQEHKSTNLAFWHLNKFSSTPELFWILVSHNSSSLLTRSLTHMRMSCEQLAQWLTLSLTNWTNYLQSVALGVGRGCMTQCIWLSAYDSVTHTTQKPNSLLISGSIKPKSVKRIKFPPTRTFIFNRQDAQQRDSQGWADYRMRKSKLPLLPLAQTTMTTTAVNHRSLQPAHSTRLPLGQPSARCFKYILKSWI